MRRSSVVTLMLFLSLCLCLTGLVGMMAAGSWAYWLGQRSAVATVEPTPTPEAASKEEGDFSGFPTTYVEPPVAPVKPMPALTAAEIEQGRATLEAINAAVALPNDVIALSQRFGLIDADAPRTYTGKSYQIGESETFLVADESDEDVPREATLQGITEHAYWWIEEGYVVEQADLELAMGRFESQTYPTTRAIFGTEPTPGVDSDPRLHIYLGEVPGYAGYYSGST